MKNLLLFLLISTPIFSQNLSIKGVIQDAKTGEKLPFVSVYLNNTSKGSFSDENGNFQINNINLSKVELVASMIGYETFRQTIEFKNEKEITVSILLKAAENALNEVVIEGKKDKKWQNQFNRFAKEFFGNTSFARQCKIENGYILQFEENKETEEFTAKANQPLIIENQALGYKVYFELRQFKVNPNKTSITGLTRFENIKTDKSEVQKKWQTNRMRAYLGSEKHFFTSIYDKSYMKEGFMIYQVRPNFQSDKKVVSSIEEQLGKRLLPFDSTNILILDRYENNNRKIALPKEIEVLYTLQTNENSYRDAPYPVSWIYNSFPLEISPTGNVFNTNNLELSGEMANRRIAEILPLDYEPNESIEIEESKTIYAQNAFSDYQEFPYLHFSKPYYQSGERIWFKAYLLHRNPMYRDSLSKVLYVDLINSKDKIIEKKLLKVQNGVAWGDFLLPDDKIIQNYRIRAYSAWMLNFGEQNFYQKDIPVLLPNQKVSFSKNSEERKNELFDSKFETQKTDSCDIIKLKIKLEKSNGKANFSISVVNALSIDEEKENISNFKPNFGALAFKEKYSPEQNLSFRGKTNDFKRNNLAIINQANGQIRTVETDSVGNFVIDNLDFKDSLNIGIQAKNTLVSLDSLLSPPILKAKKVNYSIKDTKINTSDFITNANDKILDEVVVKANKQVIEERKEYLNRFNKTYGNPDVSIEGEEVTKAAGTAFNLLTVLQGRVPGLRVVERISPNGGHETAIEIRTATTQTFQSSTSPLLLLDGIRMENTNAFMEISPYNIERIDIIKSLSTGAIFGSTSYNGVIAVYTKANSNKSKEFRSKNVDYQNFTIQGFASPATFKPSPNATTIFWQPNLSTENGEAEVSFNVFQRGKFRIIIEGMNEKCEVGRKIIEIER